MSWHWNHNSLSPRSYIVQFTGILNQLHDDSRTYSNVIPNAGINVLSSLDIFDSREDLAQYINNHFRDLYFRARDFHAEFEEFIGGISVDLDRLLDTYTGCYVLLPMAFDIQAENDLESIRLCYSD